MNERKRWFVVIAFAIAMAWVESAVVFYLRTMIDRIDPYQTNPLPVFGGLAKAELVREFATLVMLFTVGMLAGKSWRSRLGYAAIAFGVWDIFYYIFLKVLCPWPNSLLDWDILFLLPLPWWGPILAPISIAILMILWGTLASQIEQPRQPLISYVIPWMFNFAGMFIALYVFMADALRVAAKGETALRTLLPAEFNWALFTVALVLMAVPLASELRRISDKRILLSNDAQNRNALTTEKEMSL